MISKLFLNLNLNGLLVTCQIYNSSGGFKGGSGGSLEHPSGTKLFQFNGEIYEKSGKMLKTNPLLMDLNSPPEILDLPLTIVHHRGVP